MVAQSAAMAVVLSATSLTLRLTLVAPRTAVVAAGGFRCGGIGGSDRFFAFVLLACARVCFKRL
jgi:hypothetical protein